MFKKLKIKKLISLLLVLLLSVNNFAAVVSDNDGSNFITKGEFDSIKNDFQTQINNYNTSIDSKIDGAIAQYLAGITLATVTTNKILISGYNKCGYYDDASYTYQYGRPTISITSSRIIPSYSAGAQTNAVRYINTYTFNWNTVARPQKGFIAGLDNYSITGGAITINQMHLDGYYTDISYGLTSNGSCYWSAPSSWPWWNGCYAYVGTIDASLAVDSNIFTDNIFGSKISMTHQWLATTTTDNFYTPSFNLASVDLKNKEDTYFIAYDGTTSNLLCTNSTSPFLYLGYGAINQTLTPTESWKDVSDSADTIIPNTSMTVALWHGDGQASTDSGYQVVNKATGPADKYMGQIGGIGYIGGHEITQMQENFENEGVKLSNVSLSAGLPLLIEKQNNIIKWIPTFTSSGDYRIWLSYEPFDSVDYAINHGKPAPGLDYVDIKEKVTGQPYVEINGGTSCTITFTMKKTSPVYLKWSKVVSGVDRAEGTIDFTKCNTYVSQTQD